MSDLEELARRVEEGAGRDQRLDAEIACALPLPDYVVERSVSASNRVVSYYSTGTHGASFPRDYTDSLDAVRSLLEHVLPEWVWSISSCDDQYRGGVWLSDEVEIYSYASSPARALLAAVLRALAAKPNTVTTPHPLLYVAIGSPASSLERHPSGDGAGPGEGVGS